MSAHSFLSSILSRSLFLPVFMCSLVNPFGMAIVTAQDNVGIRWITASPSELVVGSSNYQGAVADSVAWSATVESAIDPIILLKESDIDASSEKFLYVSISAGEARSLQVFFSSEMGLHTEENSFRSAKIFDDNEPRIYRFDLRELPVWQGPIHSLRIDVDGSVSGCVVRLLNVGTSKDKVEGDSIVEAKIWDDSSEVNVALTGPLSPEDELAQFTLPPGFEIQLVAADPDIYKPMNLNFDHKGRLWVSDSVEYPFPATGEFKGRDTIKILEDFDENGRARKITTFARDLNIPIGVLPLEDGAIGWSLPYIYRFYDDNGDDQADRREPLFGPFDHVDTHGNLNSFKLGFDGWIYSTHGYRNQSKISDKEGNLLEMTSGHTWRFQPDGTRAEIVTRGQVNPFGLCFDPLGNLYTADCHSRPVYQVLHGASYPTFSKADLKDGLGYGPEVCDHEHDSTAIAGIIYYDADQFPAEYRGLVMTGNVVTNRLNVDRMARVGGTYEAVHHPDFLKSSDPWFRPVDTQMGPDGCLYIADFYNRIIGHYEVPLDHPGRDRDRGRIWRVVYKGEGAGKAEQPRPDWKTASTEDLLADLGHANLWVRQQATRQLSLRADATTQSAVTAVIESGSGPPNQIVHSLWVLHRLGGLTAAQLEQASRHSDVAVRTHVQRVLAEVSEWDETHRAVAVAGLTDVDGLVIRCAAEALRRHPDPRHAAPLLTALAANPSEDKGRRHVLRMAIRDQLNLSTTWVYLAESGGLTAHEPALLDVVLGSPSDQAAVFLLDRWDALAVSNDQRLSYIEHVARYAPEERSGDLLAILRSTTEGYEGQVGFLKATQRGFDTRGGGLPSDIEALANLLAEEGLNAPDAAVQAKAIDLIQSLKLKALTPRLVSVAVSREQPSDQRTTACETLLRVDFPEFIDDVSSLASKSDETVAFRSSVIRALGRFNRPEAIETLCENLKTAPETLAAPIALSLAASEEGAKRLLAEVEAGRASARLLSERDVAQELAKRNKKEISKKVESLTQGVSTLEDHVRQMMEFRKIAMTSGVFDPHLGQKVFVKSCAVCHTISNVGKKIGPELDGIGIRGLDRILEDTLDPNRNIDQAYRTSIIELESGEILSGLVNGEEGEVLLLANAQGEIIRVPKDEIVDQRQSNLSPMPANLAADLNEKNFYDLMAYLLSTKVQE